MMLLSFLRLGMGLCTAARQRGVACAAFACLSSRSGILKQEDESLMLIHKWKGAGSALTFAAGILALPLLAQCEQVSASISAACHIGPCQMFRNP